MKTEHIDLCTKYGINVITELSEVDAYKNLVDLLAKDAERYRCLRDLATSKDIRWPLMGSPKEIDDNVDAMLAAQKEV